MVQIGKVKPETKKLKTKAFVLEAWLKEDNIGKVGFVLNPKDFKLKFND